ncbi:MAG: transcription-repair coupling factor, partial [Proteobacteria bacterium]|nr:transcription-repair coupling factor [Pseudomonadota bacterium]
ESVAFNCGQNAAENLFAKAKQESGSAFDMLKPLLGKDKKVWLACATLGSLERIKHILGTHEIPTTEAGGWNPNSKPSVHTLSLLQLPLEHGFVTDTHIFFSEEDLLGERISRRAAPKKNSDILLKEASGMKVGDLIVHRDHGIGRFEGLETLQIAGGNHDCLKLIYAGGDRLFLPVENIDLISQYGGDSNTAELDKLGGVSWQTRKAKMKKRIKMAAEALLKIAALRKIRTAPVFTPNDASYDEFCSRFPYAETEDQLRTIGEVEADLASGRPMDRLVCGDVGFGKTEVALRAAFLANGTDQEGKRGQVAVITPTTLLCRQHYNTFVERFSGFPVRIRQLSRMVTVTEANKTKRDIASGEVDIVIGTHALLSKNMKFHNLSLVVVDEEQHFGVKQKEVLKTFRAETHVLTLSATPIPRTLQLSLTGARDLSLITTPPVDRLAVRTFVMPYDPMILREAILRERARGGRSFYVAPRISDLDDVQKKLTGLVPEIKVAVAHGQMEAEALDTVMNDFYDGKYDLLLSTSIIESGIDIPSANTMIIHRADRFGLAQLYQLRGRVGRSKVRAYAYLTLPTNRVASDNATKRLDVMRTLDTLGAGFTLASHDMDIRGFGNLLGEEQSGNIKEVGIELFQQMLEEAMAEIQAEERGTAMTEMPFSPQISMGASVMIPETYVNDLSLRLGLYKRIASLKSEAEIDAMAAELVDRFGSMPMELEHLLQTVRIKQLCVAAGIEKLEVGPKGAMITFYKNQFAKPEHLLTLIQKQPGLYKLRPDNKIVILNRQWDAVAPRFKELPDLVGEFVKLAA